MLSHLSSYKYGNKKEISESAKNVYSCNIASPIRLGLFWLPIFGFITKRLKPNRFASLEHRSNDAETQNRLSLGPGTLRYNPLVLATLNT